MNTDYNTMETTTIEKVQNRLIPKSGYPNINIGDFTFFEDSVLPGGFMNNILNHTADSKVTLNIGKFCAINSGVKFIMETTTPRADHISAYPFFRFNQEWGKPTFNDASWVNIQHIDIGNDVTIGYEAIIMPGVKIGDGAIIQTRAVVTKDIPAYSVVGGNPANILRMRYPEYLVERLIDLAWWNWPIEKITRNLPLLASGNIQRLLEQQD
jgi:virginiamycin A acetyltransferase